MTWSPIVASAFRRRNRRRVCRQLAVGLNRSTRTSLGVKRMFVFLLAKLAVWFLDASCQGRGIEAAMRQRTDRTSTNGLIAPVGADPDTNRSAGLHSRDEVGHDCRRVRFIESCKGCHSSTVRPDAREISKGYLQQLRHPIHVFIDDRVVAPCGTTRDDMSATAISVCNCICRRTRIAQISLTLSGDFWPTSLPLFQGCRGARIVSSPICFSCRWMGLPLCTRRPDTCHYSTIAPKRPLSEKADTKQASGLPRSRRPQRAAATLASIWTASRYG
jgi:hypothetical protein